MPEISRFYGIIIRMHFNEHGVPHFHAHYGKQRASIEILTLQLIEGEIPKRALAHVLEWAFEHRKRIELTKDLSLWLAPPEYVIIRKLEFYREGGSEKHLRDIENMLPQVGDSLDDAFLHAQISKRGLQKFWESLQA